MSTQKVARTRTLTRTEEPHPVHSLIGQASSTAAPDRTEQPAAPAPAPAPAPASAAPASAAPAAPADPDSGAAAKKQVNYRLAPGLIEDLKTASIVYSYRQHRQISQNQIVETALREWLDTNGPWEL
jgi:hypothetical protein